MFAVEFNREFAAQLHVFAEDDVTPAAERGPEVTTGEQTLASGNGVSAERLGQLFTPGQIDKLMSFCTSHVIPERLFNGDDVNATTAQQRILLAGHILATGRYTPGSFEQDVHARMCGHWVSIVNHYAGVSEGLGRGVREEFDHAGGLSLGVSDRADGTVTGTHRDASIGDETGMGTRIDRRGERSDFQREGLPIGMFETVQAGDWLYVYNDNGPGGGNHSVIFSRWGSGIEPHVVGGRTVHYRRAVTMSQGNPATGGREELRYLGEAFVPFAGTSITPIVEIIRVDPSARPMRTVEDLVAILGTDRRDADDNERFVQGLLRRGGGGATFDWSAFCQYVREQNDALITRLAPHMTANQQQVFRDTNEGRGAGEGDVPRLVRLHQRLTTLVTNAARFDAGADRERSRAEARHAAAAADTAANARRHALEERIATLHAELDALQTAQGPLEAEHERYTTDSTRLGALRQDRRRHRERAREIRTEMRRSSMMPEDRAALVSELDQITAHLTEIRPEIERLEDHERDHDFRDARRAARRAARHGEVAINQHLQQLSRAQRDLDAAVGATGYESVHGGIDGAEFNGRGEARRLSGHMRDLSPAPTWSTFIRAGAGS